MNSIATPPANELAVAGACFYLKPNNFAQRTDSFLRLLGLPGGVKVTRYVLMSSPATLAPAERVAAQTWVRNVGRYLDISAYSAAALRPDEADLFLFFNDTLFIKHPWRSTARQLSVRLANLATMSAPGAAGIVHPSTDLLILDSSNPTRRHLSTFCFILNRAGLVLFNRVLAELPGPAASEQMEWDWLEARMSRHSALRHLLHVHLTGPTNPHSWRAVTHKAASSDLLRRKAVTVVFEYLLTHAMLEAGGMIVPVNLSWSYRLWSRLSMTVSHFNAKLGLFAQ